MLLQVKIKVIMTHHGKKIITHIAVVRDGGLGLIEGKEYLRLSHHWEVHVLYRKRCSDRKV